MEGTKSISLHKAVGGGGLVGADALGWAGGTQRAADETPARTEFNRNAFMLFVL